MGCGATRQRRVHRLSIIKTFRIHPDWNYNLLRVRRTALDDGTLNQSDTKLAAQQNDIVAAIPAECYSTLLLDIDESLSTEHFWKLAPGMESKLQKLNAVCLPFDPQSEGYIIRWYMQEGSPLRCTLEPLVSDLTLTGGGTQACREHPAYWAISLEQLNELDETARETLGADYASSTMHDVVRRVIMPCTATSRVSYALDRNSRVPLLLNVFVSHCWSEGFPGFVRCIGETFRSWLDKPRLWICATALFQTHDPQVVAQQVSADPSTAPFTRALRHAQTMLVVRNSEVDLYTRAWCIWELFLAERLGLLARRGGLQVTGPDAFRTGEAVDIAACHASSPEDKQRILQSIGDHRQKVNDVATWLKHHT